MAQCARNNHVSRANQTKFMKTILALFLSISTLATLQNRVAADNPALDEHLEPLRPLLGKTWRGPMKNSTPEKPVIDICRWERALNGKAVRVLHSINQGEYGGETIILWDSGKQSLVYFYFTTAGFRTTGTMTSKGQIVTSHETVASGSAEGVTEVRATTELRRDGTMHVKSEYFKNGEWVPGHEITYSETAKVEVVFK